MPDAGRLRRFVSRARRVQSHSLVRDREELQAHAQGHLTGQMDMTGQMTLVRRLPADEEVFESLAARLRPLTLKTELVHYSAVLDAVECLLESGEEHEALRQRAGQLSTAWAAGEFRGVRPRPSPSYGGAQTVRRRQGSFRILSYLL